MLEDNLDCYENWCVAFGTMTIFNVAILGQRYAVEVDVKANVLRPALLSILELNLGLNLNLLQRGRNPARAIHCSAR